MPGRIKALVEKRAVLTYFVLTIAISWLGGLVLLGPDALPLEWERFEKLGGAFYAVILAGPFLASLLLTGFLDGPAGLRAMFDRVRKWRLGAGWYALALAPALLVISSRLALSLIDPDMVPAFFRSDDKGSIVAGAVGAGLLFGVFEEIGWTGFAVPRLRLRHSVVTSGLVVGLVWGAWHFPLFWERDSFSGALPLALLLVGLFSWLPPFRILLVWIHERTGSLLVVMLMHASVSFSQIILFPGPLQGTDRMVSLLVLPATMWLLVAVPLLATTPCPMRDDPARRQRRLGRLTAADPPARSPGPARRRRTRARGGGALCG